VIRLPLTANFGSASNVRGEESRAARVQRPAPSPPLATNAHQMLAASEQAP
jgi:hypothetical protein